MTGYSGARAGGQADVIVSFHTSRTDLERRLPALRALMESRCRLVIRLGER